MENKINRAWIPYRQIEGWNGQANWERQQKWLDDYVKPIILDLDFLKVFKNYKKNHCNLASEEDYIIRKQEKIEEILNRPITRIQQEYRATIEKIVDKYFDWDPKTGCLRENAACKKAKEDKKEYETNFMMLDEILDATVCAGDYGNKTIAKSFKTKGCEI